MVKLSENWNPASPTPIAASFLRQSTDNKQLVAPNRIPQLISARYYDPGTSEFISTDPMEYVDGMSGFRGYFVISSTDPKGFAVTKAECEKAANDLKGGKGRWGRRHQSIMDRIKLRGDCKWKSKGPHQNGINKL